MVPIQRADATVAGQSNLLGVPPMDDARRFESWIKDLTDNQFDPGSSVDQTIENLCAAGPAAVRHLTHYYAEGRANAGGFPENLKGALIRLSLADPETFLACFPDVVMDETGTLIQALA